MCEFFSGYAHESSHNQTWSFTLVILQTKHEILYKDNPELTWSFYIRRAHEPNVRFLRTNSQTKQVIFDLV